MAAIRALWLCRIKSKERAQLGHAKSDKLVYCHEALHLQNKLQKAGAYPHCRVLWFILNKLPLPKTTFAKIIVQHLKGTGLSEQVIGREPLAVGAVSA